MDLDLKLSTKSGASPLRFSFETMINAGYVGRDQAEVRRHIEELAAKGIPAPATTPVLFPKVAHAITTADSIEVYGEETSGELEYVLLVRNEDEIYVGVGSDHTDRKLEEVDIPRSKQLCPNVLGSLVWPLSEVSGHWDQLSMRCHVAKGSEKTLYQETRLKAIMSPQALMDFIKAHINIPLKNAVIYSGTVGLVSGKFIYADRFEAELVDEVLQRKLTLAYDIHPLQYMVKGE